MSKRKDDGPRHYYVIETYTPENHALNRSRMSATFWTTAEPSTPDFVRAAMQAFDNGDLMSELDAADIVPDGDDRCHASAYANDGEYHWLIAPARTPEEMARDFPGDDYRENDAREDAEFNAGNPTTEPTPKQGDLFR
jgi:hypothetical protein